MSDGVDLPKIVQPAIRTSAARLDKTCGPSINPLPVSVGHAGMSQTTVGDANIMIRVAFVIGDYPAEQRRLREETALSYSSAEVEVGILSVKARPFDGLTPAEIQAAAPIFHEAFRQAEREGYDAVVPLGMLDIGVEGGRSAVDIPVVGPLQATLHVAAQVGEHFGVVCYHPASIYRHRAQCIAYGMEQFIAGRRASGFYVQHIADNRNQMIESFLMAARALIEEDRADVIIPQGITQCPVQMKPKWLSEQLGVPVVEGIGAPIRLAATLVSLGLKQSRLRWQKEGSQAR
jgi:allantoin racemase